MQFWDRVQQQPPKWKLFISFFLFFWKLMMKGPNDPRRLNISSSLLSRQKSAILQSAGHSGNHAQVDDAVVFDTDWSDCQHEEVPDVGDDADCGVYDEDGEAVAASALDDYYDNDNGDDDYGEATGIQYNFDTYSIGDQLSSAAVDGVFPIRNEVESLNRPAVRNELTMEFLSLDLNKRQLEINNKNVVLFDPNGGTDYLAHEFNTDYLNWAHLMGINISSQSSLLKILKKYFPNANFPDEMSTQSKKAPADPRSFEVDVCPDGCCSFILDRKHFIRCPVCNTDRFTPCDARVNDGVGGKCSDKDCTPFKRVEGKYFHSSGRSAVRTAKYRPIIPLFKELVRLNIGEGKTHLYNDNASSTPAPVDVLKAFDIEVSDDDTNRDSVPYVHDINSSKNAEVHKRDMKFNFEHVQNGVENENIELINVSFLISLFYDGGTLFKRKSMSVWPLVMSILNTSPNIRVKPGLGMFLVALHDLSVGTGAEQSLFTELLVPELNELHNGVKYSFEDNTGKTVHAFIQVRLLCHVLDTKALMSTFFVSGVGSLCCCALCNCMNAVSRKQTIDRIPYRTARNTLRQDHPLRFCGYSKQCCPKGYYDGSAESVESVTAQFLNYNQDICDIIPPPAYGTSTITRAKTEYPNFVHFQNMTTASCEDEEEYSKLPAKATPFNLVLENKKYKWSHFSSMVFHAHCDYRKKVDYSRWDDYEFRSKIYAWWEGFYINKFKTEQEAKNLPPLTHKQMLKKLEVPMKFITTNRVRGIHGVSPYNLLMSAGYYGFDKSVVFDPFHAFMNFVSAVIAILKGTSGRQAKCIKLCLCENRFPFIKLNTLKQAEEAKKAAASAKKLDSINKNSSSSGSSSSSNNNDNDNNNNNSSSGSSNNNDNKIPYCLSAVQQEIVDWTHASIIIPKGLKSSYSFRKIFTATGHLKGSDKIKLMTSFINFDLAFTNLIPEYKNLLSLFSDLLSDILCPAVSDDEIATLFCRTLEALCLWDAMLPDSEQDYAIHELLDVVHGLSMYGPVRGWWALAGERFMAKIKRFCPLGGTRCIDVIYNNFVAHENSIRHHYDPMKGDDVDLFQDVHGDFKNWRIRLLGKSYNNAWNAYASDNFYNYLANFVNLWEVSHMELYSSFYRIYRTFYYSVNKKVKDNSFTKWISTIVEKQLFPIADQERNVPEKIIIDYSNSIQEKRCKLVICDNMIVTGYDIADLGSILEFIHSNTIMEADLATIFQLYYFQPSCYNRAVVKGLKFRGRGANAAESQAPSLYGIYKSADQKLRVTHNPLNNLKIQWPYNVSTLAKIRNWKVNKGTVSDSVSYGHCNYFFTLDISNDTFLNGTKFANVTARHILQHVVTDAISIPYIKVNTTEVAEIQLSDQKHTNGLHAKQGSKNMDVTVPSGSKRRIALVDTNSSISTAATAILSNYDEELQFISLNFFESTNVAACGVTASRKPVLVKSLVKGFSHAELLQAESRCSTNVGDAEDLFLIDLHKNRGELKVSLPNSKL